MKRKSLILFFVVAMFVAVVPAFAQEPTMLGEIEEIEDVFPFVVALVTTFGLAGTIGALLVTGRFSGVIRSLKSIGR